ncbi:ABC transporter ATP-binding protein [Corynebacterium ulceribovis]|uniref:ABC transporter ATP-binding protein n=1 Tax=Corynebacterium ulceribovis TaxID=487732 RepID=UPI000371F99D|nr:ABC transporter ATP-binding protein [Corynebacterium ulceribovis]
MIRVEGLTKQYGTVRAVDDLSFEVKPGIVTGFLGPNGSGKSTTMRMIMGLDRPTAGTATIDGKQYAELKNPLTQIGALLDAKWFAPNRSARDHLRWIARSNGIGDQRVDEVLEMVGLTEVAKKKAGGFSLGMGQRLGLATALLGDPQTIMLDEPVNGLDPEGIRWVRLFLKQLAAEGRSVLVSSHLLSEMAQTADHLVVIGRGKLIANTSVHEFIKESSQVTTVVRSEHMQELAGALREMNWEFREEIDADGRMTYVVPGHSTDEVGQVAYSFGALLLELAERKASLEEVYMQRTGDHVQYRADLPVDGADAGAADAGAAGAAAADAAAADAGADVVAEPNKAEEN